MVGTLNQIMRSESYFICTVEILLGLYVLVSNSWSCLHVLDVIGHALDVTTPYVTCHTIQTLTLD